MSTIVKQIEVKTPNGERIALLRIEETVIGEIKKEWSTKEDYERSHPRTGTAPTKPSAPVGGNGAKPQNGSGKTTTEDMMTDSQKRYLFRIMAERGKIGDEAHDELKRLFKAKTLKDVTKLEASQMIEELLKKQNAGETTDVSGNGGDDGSSF